MELSISEGQTVPQVMAQYQKKKGEIQAGSFELCNSPCFIVEVFQLKWYVIFKTALLFDVGTNGNQFRKKLVDWGWPQMTIIA